MSHALGPDVEMLGAADGLRLAEAMVPLYRSLKIFIEAHDVS